MMCEFFSKKPEHAKSKVTIYVWNGATSPVLLAAAATMGKPFSGHISLETEDIYASFWPFSELSTQVRKMGRSLTDFQYESEDGDFTLGLVRSKDADTCLLGKEPDEVIELQLDARKIRKAFEAFQASGADWGGD